MVDITQFPTINVQDICKVCQLDTSSQMKHTADTSSMLTCAHCTNHTHNANEIELKSPISHQYNPHENTIHYDGKNLCAQCQGKCHAEDVVEEDPAHHIGMYDTVSTIPTKDIKNTNVVLCENHCVDSSDNGFPTCTPPVVDARLTKSIAEVFHEPISEEISIQDKLGRQQSLYRRLRERQLVSGVFSLEEIAKHNSIDDCWLAAHGKVYDVTPMLHEHPAGVWAILRHGGKDATVDFDFHSKGARRMWKQYEIGTVEGTGSSCVIM